MSDINPFLKYVMKDEKEDIVHSSAYARAQNGGSFGAASTQSFAERQRLEQNRQIIQGYGASRIANSGMSGGPRAKSCGPGPMGGTMGGTMGGARPAGGMRPAGAGPRPVSMPKPLGVSGKR